MEIIIPKKVRVAGIEYGVAEIEHFQRDNDLLGQILYTHGIIKLDSAIANDRKEQVFIHELLHGIFFEAGIEEQDEDMINRVAIVLYQVLKDNRFEF